MNKWLSLDLARIPSLDGKRIGIQPIKTDGETMSWQCHVISNVGTRGPYTVIAVEERSRYAIILPFEMVPTKETFQSIFWKEWNEQMIHLMLESEAISEHEASSVVKQMLNTPAEFIWYKNTDLSVNGHVSDTEQWVRQNLNEYGLAQYDQEEAFALGLYINKQKKKKSSLKGKFFPVSKMLDDALFHFAKGLADCPYPTALDGNFPNPYFDERKIKQSTKSNVVQLSDYRENQSNT